MGSETGGQNVLGERGFLFCLLFRAALQHMEVPRLGVEPELQLPACATAIIMQDL